MTRSAKLPPDALSCLKALIQCADSDTGFGEDAYFGFWPVSELTKLEKSVVRRNVRFLARKGLAEFARGLTTIDGDFAGSGYRATRAGRDYVAVPNE